MYRDKWVDFLEVSKRIDYNPSSTFYFWYLDQAKLLNSILQTLYKSIYNVRLRKNHEAKTKKSLLEFVNNDNVEPERLNNVARYKNFLIFFFFNFYIFN